MLILWTWNSDQILLLARDDELYEIGHIIRDNIVSAKIYISPSKSPLSFKLFLTISL